MARLWKSYKKLLELHPWKTQIATTVRDWGHVKVEIDESLFYKAKYHRGHALHKPQRWVFATLMSLGDVISQTIVERKGNNYSIIRTVQFGFFGTIFVGPTLRTWYLIMERLFGVGKKTALFKLVADQACFAPLFLATFICGMELLKGNTWNQSKNQVVQNFKPVLMSNYQLWPAVQICNFYFVPFQYRILVVNTTAVGWNTYLAFKTKDSV